MGEKTLLFLSIFIGFLGTVFSQSSHSVNQNELNRSFSSTDKGVRLLPQVGMNTSYFSTPDYDHKFSPEELGFGQKRGEFSFHIGPSFVQKTSFWDPERDTSAQILTSMRTGLNIEIDYNYYFLSYFGFGLGIRGDFFGFDKSTATSELAMQNQLPDISAYSLSRATKPSSLQFILYLNAEIPIRYYLFFTANISARYLLYMSPKMELSANSISNSDVRYELFWNTPQTSSFVFGGSVGLRYCLLKNISLSLNVEYLKNKFIVNPTTHIEEITKHTEILNNEQGEPQEVIRYTSRTVKSSRDTFNKLYGAFSLNVGVHYTMKSKKR